MMISTYLTTGLPFDAVDPEHRARVYGVDYAVVEDELGGEMYVTRHGWPLLWQLDPRRWYAERQYTFQGTRLSEGTGAVYRVPVEAGHRRLDFVVKFSRFAQEVPLHVQSTFSGAISQSDAYAARFLDPFAEFGLVADLRRGRYGPADLQILTKRPLAIYRTGGTVSARQLGRSRSRFKHGSSRLAEDQAAAEGRCVNLQIDHEYVVLFQWVRGENAGYYARLGMIDPAELDTLTRRVADEIAAKGFRVLDHKPQHVILRQTRRGELLRRRGRLVYALVDFELMTRTPEYERFLLDRKSA